MQKDWRLSPELQIGGRSRSPWGSVLLACNNNGTGSRPRVTSSYFVTWQRWICQTPQSTQIALADCGQSERGQAQLGMSVNTLGITTRGCETWNEMHPLCTAVYTVAEAGQGDIVQAARDWDSAGQMSDCQIR